MARRGADKGKAQSGVDSFFKSFKLKGDEPLIMIKGDDDCLGEV